MILEKEKNWWQNISVYQIYPKSFYDSNGDGYGDINGIREKLPYIKSLGVDAVWVCPFFKSPQADNGYDVADYCSTDPIFGKTEDVLALIDECHNIGLKFIMDFVGNHTSDEHEWFQKALAGDEKYMEYYYFRDGKNGKEPCNWASVFGGSAWEYVPSLDKYYLHTFHKKQPDLNWNNKEVVDEIISVMKWWAEKGVDGFRLDAFNYLDKDLSFPDVEVPGGEKYGFGSRHYACRPLVNDHYRRLNREVFEPYNLMTVAEVAYAGADTVREYTGKDRREINMAYMFDMLDFDQEMFDKFSPLPFNAKAFRDCIFNWQKELSDDGRMALFISNHDQPRSVSRFGNDGEYREKCAMMNANTMYMLNGTPYIFEGEEIGMTNLDYTDISDFRDVEVFNVYEEKVIKKGEPKEKWISLFNRRSRDNGRSPMQWNSDNNSGFTKGEPWMRVNGNYKTINVENCEKDEKSVLNFYRKLLSVRKSLKSIQYGKTTPFALENEGCICYLREYEGEITVSVNNFTDKNTVISLPKGKFEVLLSNYFDKTSAEGEVTLRPYESITAVMTK